MSLFLFAKQIVDMLYLYKILDYIMVGLVLLLLLYQIMLVRPDFRKMFTKADGIVIVLSMHVTVSFWKSTSEYELYFKILSAFLIYFVGRIYYERIQECYGALVSSSYIVVYLNLFCRILNFNGRLMQVTNAGGDLYYYDTDMAFAMILSFVFIAMFGKNSLFKLFTILLICPYMVFYSDAGIQKVLMLVVFAIIAIYIAELVLRKSKISNILLITMVVGIVVVVIGLYLPVLGLGSANSMFTLFDSKLLDYNNMKVRYAAWSEVLGLCKEQDMVGKLFGNGLAVGVGGSIHIESLYIKIYYSLGWIGLLFALVLLISVSKYIVMVKDRKTFYLMVMLVVIFLGTGVTINSMERVQMSWFPMLFAGMVVSSVEEEA